MQTAIDLDISDQADTDKVVARLRGRMTVETVTALLPRLLSVQSERRIDLDLGDVTRVDTAGGWLLCTLERQFAQDGRELRIVNAGPDVQAIIESVRNAMPDAAPPPGADRSIRARLDALGRSVSAGVGFFLELTGYLGIIVHRLFRTLRHPRTFRLTALVAHCEDVGLRAVPIVALMAFLIGVVLAFQGSAQLRQFGAEVFVVDLIAISILRELGILLTAIIVAGRTASAFTAAIGSMKMREEIDAMRTLGLDPPTVLFLPRVLALLLMLPILGLIANLMGLLGGALMAWIDLGISPMMFQTRLLEGTDISHLFVGMIKAPVFAMIIGIVGCHAGMRVGGNAESLGRMTSNAVVTAIFAVIVADALFSIFFAQVGL
ncbi:ABC transporter permease [Yoonia sp.]|uniref:ABC transporter permease n=1 Tax=Yoonia sp. TaxID=2212373 RepID=UPI002FD8E1BA